MAEETCIKYPDTADNKVVNSDHTIGIEKPHASLEKVKDNQR